MKFSPVWGKGKKVKMNKLMILVTVGSLGSVCASNAALVLNGSFSGNGTGQNNGYSSSSMQLSSSDIVTSTTGDLVSSLPDFSILNTYSTLISSIGSGATHSTTENIANFVKFTTSTTPNDNFSFTLKSIYYAGSGSFDGTGILQDSQGIYYADYASFIVSFTGPINKFNQGGNGYGFTLATTGVVPEPAAFGALAGALAILPMGFCMLRKRLKVQAI